MITGIKNHGKADILYLKIETGIPKQWAFISY